MTRSAAPIASVIVCDEQHVLRRGLQIAAAAPAGSGGLRIERPERLSIRITLGS